MCSRQTDVLSLVADKGSRASQFTGVSLASRRLRVDQLRLWSAAVEGLGKSSVAGPTARTREGGEPGLTWNERAEARRGWRREANILDRRLGKV